MKRFIFFNKLFKHTFKLNIPDYYFVSYPKSGRTWVRFFLAKYISFVCKKDIDIDLRPTRKLCSEHLHINFTHLSFRSGEISADTLKNKDVIYMVRDPRDVVVSLFFQMNKREKNNNQQTEIPSTISDFVRSEKYGIQRIVDFTEEIMSNIYIYKSFYVISYEDLRLETKKEFKKLLEYLYSEVKIIPFKKAIKESTFENMRKIEKKGTLGFRLKPGDVDDPESYKVRKGVVRGFEEYLSAGDIEFCNKYMFKNSYFKKNYKK